VTYFSCARFDRGDRNDLRVIATELSVRCSSKRYRRWLVYDGVMIALWPVGTLLGLATLLFKNRKKLNPQVNHALQTRMSSDPDGDVDGFQLEKRRHAQAMGELSKLKVRNADESLRGLEFLYEEYEPRCYLFPIFEMARRLFLSAVLAVFYPGSMQQLVVGLLGAMLSYVVYAYFQAFIEDDDDVVAAVAQGQLVLVYFAAMSIFTSEVSEQKQGVFSDAGFGAVLVFVFFASFLVALYAIVLEVFGHRSIRYAYSQVWQRSSKALVRARRLSSSYFSGTTSLTFSQTQAKQMNGDEPWSPNGSEDGDGALVFSLDQDDTEEDVPGARLSEDEDEFAAADEPPVVAADLDKDTKLSFSSSTSVP